MAADIPRLLNGKHLTRCVLYDSCRVESCGVFEEHLTDPIYQGLEETILALNTPVYLGFRVNADQEEGLFQTVAEAAFPRLQSAGKLLPVEIEHV